MPVNLRREQCCVIDGCLRPAREAGGYCTTCWRGLAPEKRDMLRWEAACDAAGQSTDEIDADAVRRAASEIAWLEALLSLPAAPDGPPEQWGEAA